MEGFYHQEINPALLAAFAPRVGWGTFVLSRNGGVQSWRSFGYMNGNLTLDWSGTWTTERNYKGNAGEFLLTSFVKGLPDPGEFGRKPSVYDVVDGGRAFKIGNSVYRRFDPASAADRSKVLAGVAQSLCGFQHPHLMQAASELSGQIGRHYFSVTLDGDFEGHMNALRRNQDRVEITRHYRVVEGSPETSARSLGGAAAAGMDQLLRTYDPSREVLVAAHFPKYGTHHLFRGDGRKLLAL